jgi:hypothetical protein
LTWFLFLLVVVGVSAVFLWDYRRKAARREAASKERLERMFKAKAATDAKPQSSPAAAPFPEAAVTPKPSAGLPAFRARDRFLGQPQTLAYLLLKTGLPDLQVFANVTLASVVNVPQAEGPEREQQLRRLSQCRLDFVVCSRDMRILAVVDVDAPENRDAGMQRYKSDCLTAAGVRLVRINPLSLPSRESVRGLVCGGPEAARK